MPLEGEYEPGTDPESRDQAEAYRRSNGAEQNTMLGYPIIVITTIGARTGRLRRIPLMRVEHEGEYAVVASLGGAPKHPVWYYNLVANPVVELQDGAVTRDYAAREVAGDERAAWWDRSVAAYPPFAEYQTLTDRLIPVFVLSPIDRDEAER